MQVRHGGSPSRKPALRSPAGATGSPAKLPCRVGSGVGLLMKNGWAISALQIKGPFIYYRAPLRMSINFFLKANSPETDSLEFMLVMMATWAIKTTSK